MRSLRSAVCPRDRDSRRLDKCLGSVELHYRTWDGESSSRKVADTARLSRGRRWRPARKCRTRYKACCPDAPSQASQRRLRAARRFELEKFFFLLTFVAGATRRLGLFGYDFFSSRLLPAVVCSGRLLHALTPLLFTQRRHEERVRLRVSLRAVGPGAK